MRHLSTILLTACVSTAVAVATIVIAFQFVTPEPVQAEEPAPPKEESKRSKEGGIRIAVVNLEELSRNSEEFKQRKREWEMIQNELTLKLGWVRESVENKRGEIQEARVTNEEEEIILMLRVELQATQEMLDAMEDEYQDYLSTLLNLYQTEVLQVVVPRAISYAEEQGYDMLLQDYSVDAKDDAFMAGSDYAQAIMAKPILGILNNTNSENLYVHDITDEIK